MYADPAVLDVQHAAGDVVHIHPHYPTLLWCCGPDGSRYVRQLRRLWHPELVFAFKLRKHVIETNPVLRDGITQFPHFLWNAQVTCWTYVPLFASPHQIDLPCQPS